MKVMKNIQNAKDKFNWKLVLISFAVIIIIYFIASAAIERMANLRETIYCHFEKEMSDEVPRNECAIIKIVSGDISQLDLEIFRQGNSTTLPCSKSIEEIPSCNGETYHFTRFTLRTFCVNQPCDVDGVICGAYEVNYTEYSNYRPDYEKAFFTEPNIKTKKELMKKLDRCDV